MRLTGNQALPLLVLGGLFVAVDQLDRAAVHSGSLPILLSLGIAIAGIQLLGLRATWVVAISASVSSLASGVDLLSSLAQTLGITAAGAGGAWVLTRLRARRNLARLRDLRAALVAAVAASAVAALVQRWSSQPSAAWLALWRQHAVGVVATLPAALAWLGMRWRITTPREPQTAAIAAGITVAVLGGVALLSPSHHIAQLLLLATALITATLAGLRYGTRGAVGGAAVCTLTIYACCWVDADVFGDLTGTNRSASLQLMLLLIAIGPLLVTALVDEHRPRARPPAPREDVGRAMLRVLPDATYRLRADGTFLAAVAPTGAPQPVRPESLIGRRIHDVTDPSISELLLAQVQAAHRGETAQPVEFTVTTPSGPYDCEARFVRLPNGEVLAVARDITERKLAERQLAWQATILELIATARRRQDVFAAVISGMEQLLPKCRCSILLRNGPRLHVGWAPSLPPEYNTMIEGIAIGPEHSISAAATWFNETIVSNDLARDVRWPKLQTLAQEFRIRGGWSVPIRSTDGSVLGALAIYHFKPCQPQQSQRAFAERAAMLAGMAIERERSENLLASIQRNVSEGLYRSLPGEDFVHVNDSFAHMFGYGSADEMMRDWRRTGPTSHRASLDLLAHETLSTRQRELQLHRRDGQPFWALVSTTVAFHDDDAELICDGSVADITERKQLTDQLRQAQKMEAVGQLAGGVAHDFNNLLTAINGFAEAVRHDLAPGSRQHDDVEQILAAAKRAAALTNQLLAFGRRQVLSPCVLDLAEVIAQLSTMLKRLIGEHIEITYDLADSVRATVDRVQLEQVLLNLVINARDAMPNGGQVTIAASTATITAQTSPLNLPPGCYATITVTDNGIGMSSETKGRAFDPFFTTKGPGKGSGLGLSTVYGIVRQSGGAVSLQSQLGYGTTVSVFLPFANEMPADARPTQIPRPHGSSGLVMVVEDEDLVRQLAVRALEQGGYEVISAANGVVALELFAQHSDRIEAVVTDLVMPHMCGRELGRRLLEQNPSLHVVYMSGYTDDSFDLSAERDDSTLFINKPFTKWELQEAVGRRTSPAETARRADDSEPA